MTFIVISPKHTIPIYIHYPNILENIHKSWGENMLSTVCLAGAFYCFYEAGVAMQCIRFTTRRIKRLEVLEGASESMKSMHEIKEIAEKHMIANPKLYKDVYIPPTILHSRVRREYLEARI